MLYLWEYDHWTDFRYDLKDLILPLAQVHYLEGVLMGTLATLGLDVKNHTLLESMASDTLYSSDIEGVKLISDSVRSSVARNLHIEVEGLKGSDRYTDGLVSIMIDAVQHYAEPMSAKRLFQWHKLLFPKGIGMGHSVVGDYRKGPEPMYILSGAIGREKIHYQAPPPETVLQLMNDFLAWLNTETSQDPLIKAAIAHLWFVTIHPFEDGNGRLARTITDMLLCRSAQSSHRYYSFSAQIHAERKTYYALLEKAQHGDGDISEWLLWFLEALQRSIKSTLTRIESTLQKKKYWDRHHAVDINARQRKLVEMLWDGFEGKLTTSKWAKIAKCSQATALRDIQDLLEKALLQKATEGGRSTYYELKHIEE